MSDCKSLLKSHLLGYGRCEETGNECTCECLGRNISKNKNNDELAKHIVDLTEENLKLLDNIEHLQAKNQVLVETILEYKNKEKQLEAKVAEFEEVIKTKTRNPEIQVNSGWKNFKDIISMLEELEEK